MDIFTKDLDDFYKYRAHCTKCYDGDTCTLTIQLGFGLTMANKPCRLYGINTPELRGGTEEEKKKGIAARDFLRRHILDKDIILYTLKDDEGKYGRLLGVIYTVDENGKPETNINKLLLDSGHAKLYSK